MTLAKPFRDCQISVVSQMRGTCFYRKQATRKGYCALHLRLSTSSNRKQPARSVSPPLGLRPRFLLSLLLTVKLNIVSPI